MGAMEFVFTNAAHIGEYACECAYEWKDMTFATLAENL